MNRHTLKLPLVLFAALLPLLSHAQTDAVAAPPATVDLATVLRLARESSPRLSLERQGIAGAEAERISAGAYPNPSVSYGRFRPRSGQATLFDGSRQEQMTFDIPLLIAGQRSARVDKADLEIDAARARVAAGTSTLTAEAGSAYVALQAAQEKSALLSATRAELERLRNIVAGRAESGMASRYDVTRMDVELGAATSRLEEAKADIADRSGQLAALLGFPGWQPRASGVLAALQLADMPPSPPRDIATSSPALRSALSEEKVAESAVELAQRERWPTPSFSVGRSWTSDPFGSANFVGFSVEIPLLDTRRGALKKAESDARAARLRRNLVETEVRTNLERYSAMIAARRSALQSHDQGAARQLPALKQMAEDAYRLGRGMVFDLLDATRARLELQQTRVDLLASLVDAQLRYLAISGRLDQLPAQIPGKSATKPD